MPCARGFRMAGRGCRPLTNKRNRISIFLGRIL